MKIVEVEKPIRNAPAVRRLLRESDPPFAVINVGHDAQKTYVYLEDHEEKDPGPVIQAWNDPDKLVLSTLTPAGPDGVAEVLADGKAVHVVEIRKVDAESGIPKEGSENIEIRQPEGLPMSARQVKLDMGRSQVTVGPLGRPGQFTIEVVDPMVVLGRASLELRFVRPAEVKVEKDAAQAPLELSPEPEKRKTFWQKIMGLLNS